METIARLRYLLGLLFALMVLLLMMMHSRIPEKAVIAPPNDFSFATDGDDIAVYNPKNKFNRVLHYDGKKGHDSLWLKMSARQFFNPVFQSDIIRFHYFLLLHSDPDSDDTNAPEFMFQSFPLGIRNFESLVIDQKNDEDAVTPDVIPTQKVITIPTNPLESVI